jgi:hypothetical protein
MAQTYIALTLRRPDLQSPFVWVAERCYRIPFARWPGLVIYAYRDNNIVIAFERETGIALVHDESFQKLPGRLRKFFEQWNTREEFDAALKARSICLSCLPKPELVGIRACVSL